MLFIVAGIFSAAIFYGYGERYKKDFFFSIKTQYDILLGSL